MPEKISVRSFLDEAREDVSSPTTSNFISTMSLCRNTVGSLEEVSILFSLFIRYLFDLCCSLNVTVHNEELKCLIVGG